MCFHISALRVHVYTCVPMDDHERIGVFKQEARFQSQWLGVEVSACVTNPHPPPLKDLSLHL